MTRYEHLLVIAAEEACEVAQRATKALRFGIDEVQQRQTLTNAERLRGEWLDLITIMGMLHEEHIDGLGFQHWSVDESIRVAKRKKIEDHLQYSMSLGTLSKEKL